MVRAVRVVLVSQLLQKIGSPLPFFLVVLINLLFNGLPSLLIDRLPGKRACHTHCEESTMWIRSVWEYFLHQHHHSPVPEQVTMEPGHLPDEGEVFRAESSRRHHAQDIAFVIQKPQALLKGDARYDVKSEPVDILDNIDGLLILLSHQLDKESCAFVHMRLIVPKISHGVYLRGGTSQYPVLLKVANSEHVVQWPPLVEGRGDAVKVRLVLS